MLNFSVNNIFPCRSHLQLNKKIVKKTLPNFVYLLVLIDNEMDVIVLITLSTSRSEIVVTFRGGQNPWNVILALSMITVCYPGKVCDIKLHAGFYAAAMSLYDDVRYSD